MGIDRGITIVGIDEDVDGLPFPEGEPSGGGGGNIPRSRAKYVAKSGAIIG